MATRPRTTKPTTAEEVEPQHDDGVPTFTTKQAAVKYDGPVLLRVDGVEYRMRADRSFAASLRYLRAVRKGSIRDAEIALVDHVAGPDATNALLQVPDLNALTWIGVVKRAADHVFGPEPEDEEGN